MYVSSSPLLSSMLIQHPHLPRHQCYSAIELSYRELFTDVWVSQPSSVVPLPDLVRLGRISSLL